jgi:CDP-diacylglycerol--glycerol-3-phosphate 3-phosphatidyltransferase
VSTKLRLGWPNRITIARLLCIWPFALCLLYLNDPDLVYLRWVALGMVALMAVSDILDGYLARRLDDQSPLGAFLDPLADKVLVTVAVLILSIVGIRGISDAGLERSLCLPKWVAAAAIGKDLVVSVGFVLVRLSTGRTFIQARLLGKACTVVQVALVCSMLIWLNVPVWLSALPKVLWYSATALAVAAALDYVRAGSRYVAAVAAETKRVADGATPDGRR